MSIMNYEKEKMALVIEDKISETNLGIPFHSQLFYLCRYIFRLYSWRSRHKNYE